MSDTPRTDEREARSEGLHDEWAFTLCRQLERELNDILKILKDPVEVHLNLLRKTIAWTPAHLRHVLGEADENQWARGIHSCHNACARPMCVLRRERDAATERVTEAEILLADLAESYWRTILNDQDPSGEGLMGERVAQYWARYSHVMFKWVKYCEDTDQPKP